MIDWKINLVALEKAFEIYIGVKVIVVAHLHDIPEKFDDIKYCRCS